MKNPLIGGVRFYQRFISPGLPARCRYYPTCSQYMIDAIHTHGSVKGTTMGVHGFYDVILLLKAALTMFR